MEILSNSLLRQARRNRRLTLKQVADSVGISDSTMWKYEKRAVAINCRPTFSTSQTLPLFHYKRY